MDFKYALIDHNSVYTKVIFKDKNKHKKHAEITNTIEDKYVFKTQTTDTQTAGFDLEFFVYKNLHNFKL